MTGPELLEQLWGCPPGGDPYRPGVPYRGRSAVDGVKVPRRVERPTSAAVSRTEQKRRERGRKRAARG